MNTDSNLVVPSPQKFNSAEIDTFVGIKEDSAHEAGSQASRGSKQEDAGKMETILSKNEMMMEQVMTAIQGLSTSIHYIKSEQMDLKVQLSEKKEMIKQLT